MTRSLSPSILLAVVLAVVTLLALASGRDHVGASVDQFGDRVAAIVALVTEDAPAAKCGKTSHANAHCQAPGVLASVADPFDPRLAVGYARPGDVTRPRAAAPMPELSPPEASHSV